MTYRPMTVEHAMAAAETARKRGYDELAEIFEGFAANIARWNESHPYTIEEVRKHVGEERFWRAWNNMTTRLRGQEGENDE